MSRSDLRPGLLLGLGLLCACGGPTPDARPAPKVPDAPVTLPEGGVSPGGEATTPVGQDGRDRHRLSVSQLADSIEVVTGIRWMDGNDDRFEELAPTLGVPDWAERTTENREPDLVFSKLLDDAATEVCAQLVDQESAGGDRLLVGVDLASTLATQPAEIEAALSQALLRFHGQDVPVGDDRLGSWVWLFESATNATQGDTRVAWQAVCVALIVHPDFTTY